MGIPLRRLLKIFEFRLLAVMVLAGIVGLLLVWFGLGSAFDYLSKRRAEVNVSRWAALVQDLSAASPPLADGQWLPAGSNRQFEIAARIGNVAGFRVYDREGRILASSNTGEIGRKIPIAAGIIFLPVSGPFTSITVSAPILTGSEYLRTAYAPLLNNGQFSGLLEVRFKFGDMYQRFLPKRNAAILGTLLVQLILGVLIFWLLRRITHQGREKTQALRESKSLLQTIFDTLPVGIFVKDKDDRFVTVNKAFSEFVHKSIEELVGWSGTSNDSLSKKEIENRVAENKRVFESGEKIEHENEPDRLLDGKESRRHVIKVPLRDGQGKITGLLGIRWDVTEQWLLERELRESRQLLQTIIETLPVGVFVKDLENRYIMANQAFSALVHKTPQELVGISGTANELLSEAEKEKRRSENLRIIENGERIEEFNEPVIFLDGEERRRNGIKVPLRNEKGEITGVLGLRWDVTEQWLLERELRESRQLLQSIFDTLPVGVFVMDRENRFLTTNKAFAELTGNTPEELTGLHASDINVGNLPDRERRERENWRIINQGERVEHLDEVMEYPNGTETRRHLIKVPLRDENGNITGLLGIRWDVTEQRRMEEELRKNEELLQIVFDTLPYPIYVKDRESRILQANQALADLYHLSREAIIGLTNDQLPVSQEWQEQFMAQDLEVIESGRVFEAREAKVVYPNGGDTYIDISKFPLHGQDGEIIGLIGFQVNHTQRKNLEAQLRQSQKLEAIGLLAGGVAHEFNNLLQIILGFTQLTLSQTNPEDKRLPYLNSIERASERGAALVKNLLGFSRKQELSPRVLNPRHIIADLEGMLKALVGETIALFLPTRFSDTVESSSDSACIEADPGALEQIIINLCINAKDAMPNGGVLTLNIENIRFNTRFAAANSWARSGDFICISVLDTGEGIPESNLEHIFEPFFTTKGPQAGTGLGLSTTYGLMEQHHGFIQVESTLGAGTTFSIYFPVAKNEGAEPVAVGEGGEMGGDLDSEPSDRSGEVPPHGPKTGGVTILVSEDEAEVQNMIGVILEHAGYRVLRAADGAEAVQMFTEHSESLDLVLLDMVMPVFGGREVYQRMQGINSKVPVIFHSGYNLGGGDSAFIAEKGLRFLQKPYRSAELLEMIGQALEVRG